MIRPIIAVFLTVLMLNIACSPPLQDYHKFPQITDEATTADTTVQRARKQPIDITAVVTAVNPHIAAALFYHELGDFKHAMTEFQLAFKHIDSISIHSIEGKLLFIAKYTEIPVYYQHLDLKAVYQQVAGQVGDSFPKAEAVRVPQKTAEPPESERNLLESIRKPVATKKYHQFIEKELRKIFLNFGEQNNIDLPEDFIKEVEQQIVFFQTSRREFFERTIRRSRKYIPLIKPIFAEKEIPEELIYMATVESGFSPIARSRANALGMWQLMSRTAKYYGLKVSRYRDERYDPLKSTVAAREYLLDLLTIFGSRSFMLAMASYNTGEGNIQTALKKLNSYKDRSFWKLRSSGLLHEETNGFVPKILATIIINSNLSYFDFEQVPFIDPARYSMVKVPFKTSISSIAKASGISIDRLLELNPDLAPDVSATPAKALNYPLFIPKAKLNEVEKKLAALHKVRLQKAATYPTSKKQSTSGKEITDFLAYKVRKGNTLSEIAGWFNTSVRNIKKWNNFINNRELRYGDIVKIYEIDPGWRKLTHKVKAGESLSGLSKSYNIPIKTIQGWNGLSSSRIYKSQRLILYKKYKTQKRAASSKSKAGIIEKQFITKGKSFHYQVAAGNTLDDIAEIFGLSTDKIKKWNNLSWDIIDVGSKLTLYAPRNISFIRYSVQKGDNLSRLSKKFGVTISMLKKLNNLKNSRLYVGDELRVFTFGRY